MYVAVYRNRLCRYISDTRTDGGMGRIWRSNRRSNMMEKFCINPKCEYNKIEARQNSHSMDIEDDEGGRWNITRHIYSDLTGGVMKFCCVCHKAIQISVKGL